MPDNAIFYQAAYAATIVLYVGYALSILVRRRRLQRMADRSKRPAP